MNDQTLFNRFAAIAAFLAAPVGLASIVLIALAVDFNLDEASNFTDMITLGAAGAGPLHLAWVITDFFGTLLLAPAALYLWLWLKPRSPNLVTLWTLFGFAYLLTAAIVLSFVGAVVPTLMRAIETASGPEQDVLLVVLTALFEMLYNGGGSLVYFFAGIWWLGTGAVLVHERRILGIVTMILGVCGLGVWVYQAFRVEALVFFEEAIFYLTYIWAAWLGITIWRRDEKSVPVLEGAATA
ncbi:MAG: hypothetical protein R3335_00340 [Anaerolineales bacterium]|nr:hypothetical protein [Anaerolineales bacterium]